MVLHQSERTTTDDAAISVTHRAARQEQILGGATFCAGSSGGYRAHHVPGTRDELWQTFYNTELRTDEGDTLQSPTGGVRLRCTSNTHGGVLCYNRACL